MYSTLTLYIEKCPVDSNITGLVSEQQQGLVWNEMLWNGLIEITLELNGDEWNHYR